LGALVATALLAAPTRAQEIDPDADSLPVPDPLAGSSVAPAPLPPPAPVKAPVPVKPTVPVKAPALVKPTAPTPPPVPVAAPAPVNATPPVVTPASVPVVLSSHSEPEAPDAPSGCVVPVAFAQNAPAKPAPAKPAPGKPAPNPMPTAPAGQAIAIGEVNIFGDQIEQDPATGLIVITGNPRAVRGMDEIRGTRLSYDPLNQEFTAEGNVVILQSGREIHSTRATYRFVDQEGTADDTREKYGPYWIRAEQLKIHPGPVYEALRAAFTTCDEKDPHYEFYSRHLDIIPGKALEGRKVGIDFLGRRIITIPKIRKSLTPGEENNRSLYPSFGYNSNTGPYVRQEFMLRHSGPVWVDGDVRLNMLREPQGGLLAASPGSGQFRASLFYRDVAENQRIRFLQVSRLPEVGYVWSPGNTPRPGQFLPHQIGAVRYPPELSVSTAWRVSAEASAGYFRQHRGDRVVGSDSESKSGGRVKLQVQGVEPVVNLGPLRLNDLRLMARQTLYDNGEAFTVFGTGIGKKVRFKNLHLGVQRLDMFTVGTTPFLFDDVELKEEWRPRLEYSTPQFNFSYLARLRGQNARLYDQVFSISKVFHCIEPRLTYRVRRSEIFLELRIPGLSGFNRARPGEPSSVESGTHDEAPELNQP
jgi:hypothetical protein